MGISVRQMAAFISVAQSSTFAEAAEKMHLSQPALSSAIKKLEQTLGGQLFSRSTRKVQLSHEGAEFYPLAKRLLQDWNDATTDIQNLFAMRRGRLMIAAMPSFANSLLPMLLKQFRDKWPEINLNIEDVVMESVIEKVHQSRAEIGFTFEPEHHEGLEFVAMMKDDFIAVLAPDHRLTKSPSVSWQMMSPFPFVAMNRGSAIRNWMEEFAHQRGIQLSIVAQANQLSTLGECVKNHLGISVVPGICRAQFSRAGLICMPIEGENLSKNIGMIKATRKALSVPAQALWDMSLKFA